MAESVTTWANGFGVWHARLDLAPMSPDELLRNLVRIRARARKAIRREIAARQGNQTFRVRVYVADNRLDHLNVMRSITYAERV